MQPSQPRFNGEISPAGSQPVPRLNICAPPVVSLPSPPVKLSVKSDYAARAVLGLARHQPAGKAVRVEHLATEQNIPANYLTQILIELKAKKIVQSQRGKDGGYLLARAPGEITLADVLAAVHGEVFDSPAIDDPQCATELRDAWRKLRATVEAAASEVNFQQLLEAGSKKAEMYYI
jgi:Rrf2 family transcriptional regulator, cysteine metabolism repressor